MSSIASITRIPELKRRLIFTLTLIAVYRLGTHIPVPGVNTDTLSKFFKTNQNTIFGMLNAASGQALENASIFALGIMPYISASIIFQLLTSTVPYLTQLSKEGESGRKKINQFTRYSAILLSIFQAYGISSALSSSSQMQFVFFPGFHFKLVTVITLAAGTAFIIWIGEQITERGIGNGTSLIIFSGIASSIPSAAIGLYNKLRDGEIAPIFFISVLFVMIVTIAVIIFIEQGQRKIPVNYAKRQVGRKLYGGVSSHLPLKLNTSGVIPPIFASSLLMTPLTLFVFLPQNTYLDLIRDAISRGGLLYYTVYVSLIVFFCFFYTAVVFNPVEVSDNLKKFGGYIPGIRPGSSTANYIDGVLTRLTVGGAIYLSLICLLPDAFINYFKVSFFFGGTTLLILVGVAIDTISQIQTFLMNKDYDGFMNRAKLRGRT